jgi:RNA polymerase sigma-70 factor (ECF subfamily)
MNRNSTNLLEKAYAAYRQPVLRYLRSRMNCDEDAEDLTQDVFVRMAECGQTLCEETLQSFLFTVARNLLFDYLRRYCRHQEMTTYWMEMAPVSSNDTESRVVAADLAACEKHCMALLPPQRRLIYKMTRYEELPVSDIADRLQLSVRTVENHLRMGRKDVRDFMRQCI